MSETTMIHVRVDDEVKTRATEALASMGLSLSEAVRLFLHRVIVEQALPLEMKVPNAETRASMKEAVGLSSSATRRFETPQDLFDDLDAGAGR
ncbi:MAG: type II toxin-antitoxin system RelB/DinJ family antitoxin [Caulobacteraceae bacterium]